MDRLVNRFYNDTFSIGWHYRVRCSHSSISKTFFEQLGTEPCKRIQKIVLEVERDDPDVLASAVHVLERYLVNAQQAVVVFMPVDFPREQDVPTSRKWARILARLESSLPKKERLRVYGRTEDVKFMGFWMGNRRQWHVDDSAENSSDNRTAKQIY